MITAQDIREKTFEKSRMNGYDMASVDDFLEELAEDISSAQKENAVLKSKMKVLVDKIEEYRANEEALNMAILSAQKLAVQIESEARQRAASMIEDAERQVKAREVCSAQLNQLLAISGELDLPEEPAEAAVEPEVDIDEVVGSIEAEVSRAGAPEPALDLDLSDFDLSPAPKRNNLSSTQSFNL